ncbi:MAG TPA: endolytic transglycosylase MltG [Gemmatimonadaceae bacterium]|nr:endolytic transglycosylase MltG [Gemmatimonadaceae bacterium]
MRKLCFSALCASLLLCASCSSPHGAPVRVIVPKGATFGVATDSLHKAGLVGSSSFFKLYARFKHTDRNIKPGTYLIKRGTPWSEILAALHGGHGLVNTITIPEGFTLAQIVPLLAQTLSVPVDSVNAAVADTAMINRLGVHATNLEGYLFPDTYAFPDGTHARDAVLEMVKRFEREWKPEWNQRLAQLGLNRHQVVTLASIVEREAKIPAERPVIAGVYLNRLGKNMLLQADPTVQYARRQHTARVLLKDLEIDSPYNTYKYPGLPPGPIASPGGPSLVAALYPANVPFLYFVAAPDGHHEFRKTLEEHEQAVRSVRK